MSTQISSIKYGTVGLVLAVLSLMLISPSNAGNNGSEGIPEVLRQLELVTGSLDIVTAKLDNIESRLASQQHQIAELQAETIPCTPERWRAGLCGDGNTPFDLVVSICAGLDGGASIEGAYSVASQYSIQGGVGWKEVIDVDLTAEASMPVVLTPPFLPPVILPNEIAVNGGASIGLGLDGCIEGIKIPIGKNIDPSRIDALLVGLEDGAAQIQAALIDAMETTYNSQAISSALSAQQSIASRNFDGENGPLSVFTSPEVSQLLANLPAGSQLTELVGNPADMIPDIDPTNLNLCANFQGSLVISQKTAKLCAFLGNDLPQFDTVAAAFQRIETLEALMLNLPDTIKGLIQEVIDNSVPTPPSPPSLGFCDKYPKFCPWN